MFKRLIFLAGLVTSLGVQGETVVPSTPYTRTLLRSTDAATARDVLGVTGSAGISPGFGLRTNAGVVSADPGVIATRTNGEWALGAIVFDNGQEGWPPGGAEQIGFPAYLTWGPRGLKGAVGDTPVLRGLSGFVRDPSVIKIGNVYYCAYTTNDANVHSTAISIATSTNFLDWYHATNVTYAMPGESYTMANNYVWSPVFHVIGSNVWLLGSVCTNNLTSFQQRGVVGTTNNPLGLGSPFFWDNQTGRGNIIDGTPYTEGTNTYAWYKDENTAYDELGRFDTWNDLKSSFRPVLTNDHSGWNSGVEGNWMVKLPNGKYLFFTTRYNGKTYGNYGDGRLGGMAIASNITGPWSTLTNVPLGLNSSSFKPFIISDSTTAQQVSSAAGAGRLFRRPVIASIGATRSGLIGYGFSFTNPWPALPITGVDTNDYAPLFFGSEAWGPVIYGQGDGSINFGARTLVSGDTNLAIFSYSKIQMKVGSNYVSILPGYLNGSALAPNSVSSNQLDSATRAMLGGGGASVPANNVTNPMTIGNGGAFGVYGNFANTPNLELLNYGASSGYGQNFGPYFKMRQMDMPNGWTFGVIPNAGNKWILGFSDNPWTQFFQVTTNGEVILPSGFAAFLANSFMARSNAWDVTSATNGMKSGDARYVSSNGWPVQVWISNGVVQIKPQW